MVNVRLTPAADPNTAAVWKGVEFSGIPRIWLGGRARRRERSKCRRVQARLEQARVGQGDPC